MTEDQHRDDDVRALLASLRVDEPVPPEVAARLDATLADLHLEGSTAATGGPATAPVRPLRRRLAPRLLAAAAAVVVLGGTAVGVTRVLQDGSGDADGGSSFTAGEAPGAGALESPTAGSGDAGREQEASGDVPVSGAAGPVPGLRAGHLAADVAGLLSANRALLGRGAVPDGAPTDAGGQAAPEGAADRARCPGPAALAALPGSVTIAVRLDGRLAALVLHPAAVGDPGERVAEVWSCSGTERLARAVVPVTR